MQLRDYQQKMIDDCVTAYRQGAKSVCGVLPTGAGKTRVGVACVRRHIEITPSASVVWLAPLVDLVKQAKQDFPSDMHVTTSTSRTEPQETMFPRVHVSTVHSLVRGFRPRCTLLVLDEAQFFFGTPEWNQVALDYLALGVRILSLTATPTRQDGAPLRNLADALVVGPSAQELIARKFLVPMHVYGPPKRVDKIYMDPVDAYLKYAPNTKAAVFCGSIEEAKELSRRFNEAGVSAGWASADERGDVIRHQKNEIKVLCNVFLLSVGYNDPSIETVIIARGCGNPSTFIQMTGRAMRPFAGDDVLPEKSLSTLIDLYGSVHQHGLPWEPRRYSLDGHAIRLSKEGKSHPLTACKKCCVLFRPGESACACSPEIVPLDFKEPVIKPPTKAEIRRLELQRILATESEESKKRYYQILKTKSKEQGWKPMAAAVRFKVKYGYFPPRSWG